MNRDKNEETLVWYGISELEIKLRSETDGSLIFANGRNMITVDVFFKATKTEGGDVIELPYDVILNNTYLIDFNSGEKLNKGVYSGGEFGWAYTNEPNEFTGVPIVKTSTLKTFVDQPVAFEGDSGGMQRISFYIYCSESEQNKIKNIAVMVIAPDMIFSTAHGQQKDSFIQLKSLEEIKYKFADAKTKSEAVNINGTLPDNVSVWQKNVYFTLESNVIYGKCLITKLETDFYDLIGKAHQCYHSNEYTTYYAHFLWDVGKESEVSIGESKWISLPINFPLKIKINQHFGELCFSILTVMDYNFPKLQDQWYDAFIFTVYDQFGNKGIYGLIPDNTNDESKQEVYFAEV
ncbi:hypothetical protein Xmau_02753 [Xenorhabdus mauleonii]|uniref:Uncharacterized protein n=1 Tax=Xenorhabdus mauleonii TaxID=351675 RepID=A0A1I3IAG0_9GAMM|nr:hypothetical protein [Xenorhabdus mauleonii]PHM39411.1 hypothetical protein Xmau_02753 [Xenorhabdus mauleonii]SFI44763.1 hypothetical protein SAMN05421680_101251 [Xenorhabdus mauleonii]